MGCRQSTTSMASMKYIQENKLGNVAVLRSNTNVENLQDARQKTEPTATETNRLPKQQEQVSKKNTDYDTIAMTEQPMHIQTNPNSKQNQLNQHAQSKMQDAATGQLSGGDAPAGSHKSGMETSGSRPQQQHNTNNKTENELKQSRYREDTYEKELNAFTKKELMKRNADVAEKMKKAKTDLATLHAQLEQKQNELHQLKYESEKDKQQLKTEHEHNVVLKKDAAKLKQDITELKQANEELKQTNEELKTRLSAVFGAKLQDNNPNIADLSDMNRPTKLAEKFSELYDNEWTNCFEVLHQQHGIGEKEAIEQMLQVCLTLYEECRSKASNDLQTLAQNLVRLDKQETDIHFVKDLKDLKEKRKRGFQDDIKRLRQPMEEKVRIIIKDRTNEKACTEFWTKCLEICWLMAIQDPPVSMETSTGRLGEIFNATFYRPYTKLGKYVDFIVWPALRLTDDGSLLYKGVAQGADTYQQYNDCVDNDVNTVQPTISNASQKSPNENASCAEDEIKRSDNISITGVGDTVIENTNRSNNRNIKNNTEQSTDTLVSVTDDRDMSQNQHIGNSKSDVPTQETKNLNSLDKKHNVDTGGNTPVNVDSRYKKTQPGERHSEESSDTHNHNTSTQSEKMDGTRAKQDKPQQNKIPTTARIGMAQHDNENPTEVNASRRQSSTSENSQISGSIQNKEKGQFGQSLKMKSAPAAPSSEHLSAEKKNMIQTESSNVQQEIKAQSVKGTANSATVVKHNTSIQVGSVRMKSNPVDNKQVK